MNIPISGNSEAGGIVSHTIFRKNVSDSKTVTPVRQHWKKKLVNYRNEYILFAKKINEKKCLYYIYIKIYTNVYNKLIKKYCCLQYVR